MLYYLSNQQSESGMSLSMKIRSIRLQLKMSQREFAKNIGFSQTAVAQWELGQKTPTFQSMLSIFNFSKSKRIKIKRSEFFSM
jgi:DNA-binding transcriptional regulator YiaG